MTIAAKPKPEDKTSTVADTAKKQGTAPDTINAPELNEKGKPTKRAVDSYDQAHAISKRLFEKAKDGRIKTGAMVLKQYNSTNPYDPQALAAANEGWRNNFSTGFLASIVDRTRPQFLDPLQRSDTITYASLPDDIEESDEKSKCFQQATTKLIRDWTGWPDFLSQLSQENTLHGNAAPGWIDDDWRPKMFAYDEAFLPEGSAQHATKCQMVLYVQSILLHDFVELVSDPEVAGLAHYDIEGCRKAANYAAGMGSERAEETDMERENRLREVGGVMGAGYTERVKTVNLYHLIVRDYTGEVDLWTTTQENAFPIRAVKKLHERMDDATCLFTLQVGSKKFYGSKGLGRSLCNIHIAVERNRCFAMDQVYLSGMTILKAKVEDLNSIRPVVRHPFIIVGQDVEVAAERLEFNYEAFMALDQKLVDTAESISGAFIPPNLDNEGSSRTKIEAAQKAERELAVKQGVLGRFFVQFADLVSAMQRKIYNADNLSEAQRLFEERKLKKASGIRLVAMKVWQLLKKAVKTLTNVEAQEQTKLGDPDAVECIIGLLEKGLTLDEIAYLAQEPASDNVQDNNEQRDQMSVEYLVSQQMNPHIDQRAATEVVAEITMGKDRAARVLVKDQEDMNEQAIQERRQIEEFVAMQNGHPVPVASIDNHRIHRDKLNELNAPVIQAMMAGPTPEGVGSIELSLDHYMQHIVQDQQMPEAEKEAEMQKCEEFKVQIDQMKQMLAAQAAAGVEPGALPAGAQLTPQDELAIRKQEADEAKAQAELELKAGEQAHRQEMEKADFQLRAKQHEDQLSAEEIKQSQDSAKLVMDEAARHRDAGLKEAEIERRATPTK